MIIVLSIVVLAFLWFAWIVLDFRAQVHYLSAWWREWFSTQ